MNDCCACQHTFHWDLVGVGERVETAQNKCASFNPSRLANFCKIIKMKREMKSLAGSSIKLKLKYKINAFLGQNKLLFKIISLYNLSICH